LSYEYHIVGHVSLWTHREFTITAACSRSANHFKYCHTAQKRWCWNLGCRRMVGFSYENWLAGRIELAVIYREIHLLRLLQQTLPSIKIVRRWADKYTEGQNLMSAQMRILRTRYTERFCAKGGERRGEEGSFRGRLHPNEEYIEEW